MPDASSGSRFFLVVQFWVAPQAEAQVLAFHGEVDYGLGAE